MAADGSLLQLEAFLGGTAATPAACRVASNTCMSGSRPSAVVTEGDAREAAIAAAAQAASLSERCRSFMPLLKQPPQRTSSSTDVKREQDRTRGCADPCSVSRSGSKGPCKATGSEETPQKGTYLEFDSDGEGPVIELVVGVGVLDVKGQVPSDARLAEMGVQVVDLPADSPVLQDAASSSTGPPLDPLQRVLATCKHPNSSGAAPIVSVLSSGSSSEGESDDSDDEPAKD